MTKPATVHAPSIFRQALGADFDRLQPELRHRFDMSSAAGTAQVGGGVMEKSFRSPLAGLAVRTMGRSRRLQFPPSGSNLPFELANYSYVDTLGRETFAYSRRFRNGTSPLAFDDTMVFSPARRAVVNYLGSHQDIAGEVMLSVTADGRLRMTGGGQRFYAGRFRIAVPAPLAARVDVLEGWDAAHQRFTISVEIKSLVGRLFGYRGWFTVREVPCAPGDIPAGVRPDRERRAD